MSIPPEALQKLVQEIETQAVAAQQQVNVVKTQMTAKTRDIRLLELTANEMAQIPRDTNVYEGVGKMFVATPIPSVDQRLSKEVQDAKTEIENLGKRLHYLEMTQKNSQQHIEAIFKGGRA